MPPEGHKTNICTAVIKRKRDREEEEVRDELKTGFVSIGQKLQNYFEKFLPKPVVTYSREGPTFLATVPDPTVCFRHICMQVTFRRGLNR